MRRRMLLVCCAVLGWCLVGPGPVLAAVTIEAPAGGLTGTRYGVAVAGTAPYEGRVYFDVQEGAACVESDSADWESVSGGFRESFAFSRELPGPVLLCVWVVDRGQAGGPVTVDRAAMAVDVRATRIDLSIIPSRRVFATDEDVRARLEGVSESPSVVWAWARPIDGAPCSEVPWVGEQAYWGELAGGVDKRVTLGPITVPGTYRLCAQVINSALGPLGYATIEAPVVISQACTNARRSRTRQTASYRRARAVYRRTRRAGARRVMLRRKAAMNRARASVSANC
ncbi:MAG: hypothetical protein JHD16_17855 [Solirubrobacteraceae bacterium]|nr:hypothetical protein [Solirubrobacteraceae bacterium]